MKLFVIGLLLCMAAVGGADIADSVADYLTLLGFSIVGLAFALIGVMDIKGE